LEAQNSTVVGRGGELFAPWPWSLRATAASLPLFSRNLSCSQNAHKRVTHLSVTDVMQFVGYSSDVIYGTLNHFTMRLAFGALRQLIISSIEQQASTRDLLSVTHLFILGNHFWNFIYKST
jgi:hypothetical protein